MFSKALATAILPSLALGALIPKRENDGDFYFDLSLRTVGARNTLVSMIYFCQTETEVDRLTCSGRIGESG